MGLFGKMFGKEEKKSCCDMRIVEVVEDAETASACDCGCATGAPSDGELLVTVMGPGCKKCHQLHENALVAAEHMPMPVRVDYVTDPVALANAGVMSTPALLVNGKVVSQGKVLSATEIEGLIG